HDNQRQGGVVRVDLASFDPPFHAGQHRFQNAAGAELKLLAAVVDVDVVVRRFRLEAGELRGKAAGELVFVEWIELAVGGRELSFTPTDQLAIGQQNNRASADTDVDAAHHRLGIVVRRCSRLLFAGRQRTGRKIKT